MRSIKTYCCAARVLIWIHASSKPSLINVGTSAKQLIWILTATLLGASGAWADDIYPQPLPTNKLLVCLEIELGFAETDTIGLPPLCNTNGMRTAIADIVAMLRSAPEQWELDSAHDNLQSLVAGYATTKPAQLQVDAQLLARLARDLAVIEPAPQVSAGQRFFAWLTQSLDDNKWVQKISAWLRRQELNPATSATLLNTILAVLIVGAVVFIVNELRTAGVFARSGSKTAQKHTDHQTAVASLAATSRLQAFAELSAIEQASQLFGQVIAKLREESALSPADSLTNLQLLEDFARNNPAAKHLDQFQRLQQQTDLAVYARRPPQGAAWQDVVGYWTGVLRR